MAKRILITGGSSYLGRSLVPLVDQQYQTLSTYFSSEPQSLPGECRQLDLRDSEAVNNLVADWQPQVIIHLAGSDRSKDMTAVIVQGAKNIVQAAAIVDARLIHLSSDVIFDGRHGPHPESEPPSPIHAYGKAKATAESIVATYTNHIIVRTSLIYSLTRMDYGTQWMASALQAGKLVTLFNDQFRNPVWTDTLANACMELIDLDYQGVLNVAGDQDLSRADFGLKMLGWWGIQARENLSIGPSPDTWPKDCRLDVTLAKGLLSTPMLGVDTVIAAHQSS